LTRHLEHLANHGLWSHRFAESLGVIGELAELDDGVLDPTELADFLESPTPRARRLRASSPFAALAKQ
jgi:hypothetical protein